MGSVVPRSFPPLLVALIACALAPAHAAAIPVAGTAIDVGPVENSKAASVKCPGDAAFAKVVAPRTIPPGCEVDMSNGWLAVTTARADGTPQTATFSGQRAHLRLTQEGDTAVLTLRPPTSCRSGDVELFAAVQGSFRTVGRYGSAATQTAAGWKLQDSCAATTTFRANDGTVEVRDFPRGRTVQLRAEDSYTAGTPHSCGNLLVAPPRSPYAAINITVSAITCASARAVLLGWLKRLPPDKGRKTKPFPTTSAGWLFDSSLVVRSRATRGIASIAFQVIE